MGRNMHIEINKMIEFSLDRKTARGGIIERDGKRIIRIEDTDGNMICEFGYDRLEAAGMICKQSKDFSKKSILRAFKKIDAENNKIKE